MHFSPVFELLSDSLMAIYVELHQCPLHHSLLLILMFTLVSRKFLAMRNIALYSVYVSKTKEHLPRKVLVLDRRLRLSIMKSWIISSSYEDNQITKSWSEWQRILFFNQIYKPQYFTLNQITKSWLEWHRIPFSYPYTKTAILHLTEPTVQTDCSSLNGHRYFLPQYRKTTLS